MKAAPAMTEDPTSLSPRSRFQTAMILAMAADALQIFVFPLFAEGALSPADDVLDLAVAAVLVNLLGWHWEFLPAFAAELVPGIDLVPFWTMAVANGAKYEICINAPVLVCVSVFLRQLLLRSDFTELSF